MITHHPDDECLWALASGQLDSGRGLLLSVHLDGCQQCHQRVQSLLSVGGEVLARAQPAELSDNALLRALQRIESAAPEGNAGVGATSESASRGLRRLDGCRISSWRKIAPGMRYRSVLVPHAVEGKMFVLGIAPGRSLPKHSHRDIEWTQVISGAFDDGRARFEAGDFDATDGSVRHQPVVTSDAECICLAHLSAPLVFESWIARAFGRWIGI
jgi:putative transcriptional regulator